MRFLTPNYVTLINACYPSSSILSSTGSTIAPKSQEISRLIYYASNRSGKIQKLGAELERRATVETRKAANGHTRYRGSLLITLAILKALASECRQEIALLTPYLLGAVCSVFSLLTADLEVVAQAVSTVSMMYYIVCLSPISFHSSQHGVPSWIEVSPPHRKQLQSRT